MLATQRGSWKHVSNGLGVHRGLEPVQGSGVAGGGALGGGGGETGLAAGAGAGGGNGGVDGGGEGGGGDGWHTAQPAHEARPSWP